MSVAVTLLPEGTSCLVPAEKEDCIAAFLEAVHTAHALPHPIGDYEATYEDGSGGAVELHEHPGVLGDVGIVGVEERVDVFLCKASVAKADVGRLGVDAGNAVRRFEAALRERDVDLVRSIALSGWVPARGMDAWLLRSAEAGDAEAVDVLVASGAVDVREACEQPEGRRWSPLHLAAAADHAVVVHALLAAGADPNVPDVSGFRPLHVGGQRVVPVLLRHGARVDARTRAAKETPLHAAAASGSVAVARALLDGGAGVEKAVKVGYRPLHIAARHGHADVVRLLLQHGACVEAAVTHLELTPLHEAARGADGAAAIAALIVGGARVNARGKYGSTPLHVAAGVGEVNAVRRLIEHGASLNATDHHGFTPLRKASWRGHGAAVAELLARGGRSCRPPPQEAGMEGGESPATRPRAGAIRLFSVD
eukprot:TRINITY_DN5104_c0_g2_i1.p2 TRINITY_DN5104_c0_g2~~TRINITY_DN5104_c0_g2_i1.p2  ORF type:complete len:424 (+),score=85.29 TRINITY_DN5104_c0_g2_i1:63-1334(+)